MTPHDSNGYSSTAWARIASCSAGRQDHAPAGQRRDDRDLVAVLQRRAQPAEPVDRLAVDVDGDVLVHLARLVAHEPLEPAVRALQLVEQGADVGRAHVDPVAVAVARRNGVGM